MYVCFKGVKDGWIAGYRKVIGIDGCFITHMCKGEMLTAIGRDGNNQMYLIAWAVMDVENKATDASTIEQDFTRYMEQIKQLDLEAYRSGQPDPTDTPRGNGEFYLVDIRVGRLITCHNCQKTGHNKASCKDPKAPKPAPMKPPRAPTVYESSRRGEARGEEVLASRNVSASGTNDGSGAKGGSGAKDGSGANGRVSAKGRALKGASAAKGGASKNLSTRDEEAARHVMQEEIEEEERNMLITEEEQREYKYNIEMEYGLFSDN
nr:hypothetical protein CTI12_AA105810 [Tanacetum cinerariifolium]